MGDFPVSKERIPEYQFFYLTCRKPFNAADNKEARPVCWTYSCRENSSSELCTMFEQNIGKGRLIACGYQIQNDTEITGAYLLRQIVNAAVSDIK